MEIDRRSLLLGTIAAIAVQPSAGAARVQEVPLLPAYVSAAKLPDGSYTIVLLSADGRVLRQVPLSDRGHDIAVHKASGRVVAFARRPGTFAVAFTPARNTEPFIFTAPRGRHFFGHGAFSSDGRLLYTSENEISTGEGVIGIYEVSKGYRRIGEHRSFGIGPHEIILLPDGATLAVANGGLDTTPEAGRENLNVGSMQASLTFVNVETGALLARHDLQGDAQQLSIRHLAADAHGAVWFGGQWQGDMGSVPELIGSARCDQALKLITPRTALGHDLKGYIGSMAVSADGAIIAASAPKAGRIVYIDAASGAVAGESAIKDGCGIAGDGGSAFAVTSGLGAFRKEDVPAHVLSEVALPDIAFDNHLRRLI